MMMMMSLRKVYLSFANNHSSMTARYHDDAIFAKYYNFFVYISFTFFDCGAIWIWC